MKKLLIAALFSAIFTGSTFAQFTYSTNATAGVTVKNLITTDKDTIQVHFNTTKVISAWAPAKTTANLGKDSIAIQKATTAKGIQVKAYVDGTTVTNLASGNFKCDSYTAVSNPVHVSSMASLLQIMSKSLVTGTTNGSTSDSLSRPATCLFDVATGNSAFGMYPGKCKRVEYAAYFSFSGKAVKDDITFDINTYDVGTTGKTASYELSVYASTSAITTFTDALLLGSRVSDFYITGSGLKSVNLSTALGKTPNDFSNKFVYIFLKTKGTPNALGVVDGLQNATSATNIPVVYDPTIVLDNFYATYGVASWVVPAGATGTSYFDHNNGTPTLGVALDFTGGTPVQIPQDIPTAIKIYVSDINRIAAMTIKEANNNAAHNAQYSFAPTGAIMAKAGDGTYSIPVTYTNTASDGTTAFQMSIAPPATGTASDDLEISLLATLPLGTNVSERLEISNGVLFRYTVGAIGTASTITASTSTLTGMDYIAGSGPSVEKSFTVRGTALSAPITITPSANLEISTGTGASFAALSNITITPASGTAALTTVYTRLKAGLTANTYTESISLASTGVTTQNISLSATVSVPAPVVTVSATALTGMDYSIGTGPSVERSFTVSGINLTSVITVTPSINFEISTVTGVSFSPMTTIEIPQTLGTATETTIYTRLKVDLAGNTYTENVTVGATGVTTKNISCTGIIVDPQNVTVQVGQNGTVSENGVTLTNGGIVVANKGTTKTFTFTPDLGYEVATLTFNGADVKSQISGGQYVATVSATSTLVVTYKKIQLVLSMKDASTGTMNMILDYGTIPAFSFTPTTGWTVSTVFYNNVDVTSSVVNGFYTAPAITANALLNVSFVSTVTGAPQMFNNKVKVYTSQSDIIVEGAAEGELVSLYTVNGVQTQSVLSNGERMVIPAIKDAVYLVKTATKTFKVIL
ncbi:MAG: hypothetical protein WCG93_06420 [Paludibacter sp.]